MIEHCGGKLIRLRIGGWLGHEQLEEEALELEHGAGMESFDKLRMRHSVLQLGGMAIGTRSGAGVPGKQGNWRERTRADVGHAHSLLLACHHSGSTGPDV